MLFYPRKELDSKTRFKIVIISASTHLILFTILFIAEKFSRQTQDLNLNINSSAKVYFSNIYMDKNKIQAIKKVQRAKETVKKVDGLQRVKEIVKKIKKPSKKPADKIADKTAEKVSAEKIDNKKINNTDKISRQKNLVQNKTNLDIKKIKSTNKIKKKKEEKILKSNLDKIKSSLKSKPEIISKETTLPTIIEAPKAELPEKKKKEIKKIEEIKAVKEKKEKVISFPELKETGKKSVDINSEKDPVIKNQGLCNINPLEASDSEVIKIDTTKEINNNGTSWQEQLKTNIIETINNYELGDLGFNKQDLICLIKIDRFKTSVEIEELKVNAIYLALLREALLKVKYPPCLYGKTLKLIIN